MKLLSEMSFQCLKCGEWLPTQEAYDSMRGQMNTVHVCYCGQTQTRDTQSPATVEEKHGEG